MANMPTLPIEENLECLGSTQIHVKSDNLFVLRSHHHIHRVIFNRAKKKHESFARKDQNEAISKNMSHSQEKIKMKLEVKNICLRIMSHNLSVV